MAKLTDRQHKKMIARYAECQNLSQVAREFKVSKSTVKRHVDGDEETVQKVTQKKEENTLDMLAFLDSRKGEAEDFVALALKYLRDENKLSRTGIQAIATAMGIVIDKYLQNIPQAAQGNDLLKEIRDGITEGKQYVEP